MRASPMRATPRYATPLPPDNGWAGAIEEAAKRLGSPLMEWQSMAARYIGAVRADGRPRFKTVVVSVPRQMGKTVMCRAATCARAELADDLQLYATAQTRMYASKHVVALGDALGDDVVVRRGIGNERVEWGNGSVLRPVAPNEGGGHGDSIDWMLVDEGWALQSHVLGGIRPAMIARPQSQMVIISTMGTVDSEVWNGIVARGRDSVDDKDADMAYLEFSAAADDEVWEEDKWENWMPALGETVTPEDIRLAIQDMLADPNQGRAEVVRAFGNRTTKALVTLFPYDWVERAWATFPAPQGMVLAVDVNEDPAGAAVASAHVTADERTATRIIEWRQGTPVWVPGLVEEIIKTRHVEVVVADLKGPTRVVAHELQRRCDNLGVPLVNRVPTDVAADHQGFYDGLREGTVALEKSEPLDVALQAAVKKNLGDMWVVSRRQTSADASPLLAVILAHGGMRTVEVRPPLAELVHF